MSNFLQEGVSAPDFTFEIDGMNRRLSEYRGRKVLLTFFRNAACALCNLRVQQFIHRCEDWRQQGMDIVAIFESPELNLREYVGRQAPPFPLVADPQALIYNSYGIEVSAEKVKATLAHPSAEKAAADAAAAGFPLTKEEGSNFERIPAEFLIDESGIIQIAYYGDLITDHLPFETIDRFVAGKL